MMKAGWMIYVRKTETGMIDNSTVYRCEEGEGIYDDIQRCIEITKWKYRKIRILIAFVLLMQAISYSG